MTAILVKRLEKGMPSKEYEAGYRKGLSELAHLYSECKSELDLEKKKAAIAAKRRGKGFV
ncbi:MAG: hypothetical protein DRN90_08025 [Thermoproteota archaeon]|nr:MAG: hypothetical protein DRN90_08025 [Candidatus Korarchaeota archaeon]